MNLPHEFVGMPDRCPGQIGWDYDRAEIIADGVVHAIGDLAVLDRHVEIDAHEHALAPHVGLIERVEHVSAHCRRARSACPSQPRLEKPHSLSYHNITRTSGP